MFWYIVICILMLYPLFIVCIGSVYGERTQHLALIIACGVLWFFMALRSSLVGVDTKYYAYIFEQFSNIPFQKVFTAETFATSRHTWSLNFEYGYRLYNKLLSLITSNPQAIIICNSSIIIFLLYSLIRKNSSNYLLSIWLYITLGIYQTEMNVTRNAIAILIVYNAFYFLKRKRVIMYIIWCVIAALFHKVALVFILLYWIIHKIQWNKRKMFFSFLAALVLGTGIFSVRSTLEKIFPLVLTRYLVSSNSKSEAILVGIFYFFLFVIIYLILNQKERRTVFEKENIGLTMLMGNFCCFGLSIGIGYSARLAALFGPYIILYIPELLSMIEKKNKKKLLTFVVVIICGCQYVLRLCINNIGGTMPYTFFW